MPKKILFAKLLALAALVLTIVMMVTAQLSLIFIPLALVTISARMQHLIKTKK